MNTLKKIWIRVLISFLLGGFLSELVYLATDINSPTLSNFIFFTTGIFSFIILTVIVSINSRKTKNAFGERIRKNSQKNIKNQ